MWTETRVLTYASLLMLPSAALSLVYCTSLRSSGPVESASARGSINGPNCRIPGGPYRTKAGVQRTVSSRAGFRAAWRRIPVDLGDDRTS